ncbi:hypothetical protein M758_UG247100 [Ceratodon purpureus]|nr:hypothetical protein M758_UG247100 [Ceratodon purpureus]
MTFEFARDFGVTSQSRDRFGGVPRWVDTVLRQYDDGALGPLHDCEGFCDCIACCCLAWAKNPVCHCPYGKQWGIAFSIDDAMRQKWWRCRCSSRINLMLSESKCRCLLLLPTQEYIISPESSVSLPSEFADSGGREWSSPGHVSQENIEFLYRLISRLEEEART